MHVCCHLYRDRIRIFCRLFLQCVRYLLELESEAVRKLGGHFYRVMDWSLLASDTLDGPREPLDVFSYLAPRGVGDREFAASRCSEALHRSLEGLEELLEVLGQLGRHIDAHVTEALRDEAALCIGDGPLSREAVAEAFLQAVHRLHQLCAEGVVDLLSTLH